MTVENTVLTITIIVTMVSSIATTIVGIVRAINQAKKEDEERRGDAMRAPIERRKSELDIADQIRDIAGKMVEDLREDMARLRVELRERDTQIGQLEERLRVLIRESRRMRAAMDEALDIARTVNASRPSSDIISSIITALEKGFQPISQDTMPAPRKKETDNDS